MNAFGTSTNPKIEQITVADSTPYTWTGTRTISKLLLGEQGATTAYHVSYVAADIATNYRYQGIGTSFAADGINLKNPTVTIYQASGGPLTFYIETWS